MLAKQKEIKDKADAEKVCQSTLHAQLTCGGLQLTVVNRIHDCSQLS